SDPQVAANAAPGAATAPAPPPNVGSAGGTDLFGNRIAANPAGSATAPASSAPTLLGASAFTTPPLSSEEKLARLKQMDEQEVRGCTKCRLCESRTRTVFGEGSPDAAIMFIGEGPGENEDLQGRPFVGRAGELLNKWIAAMGLRREQVYITNIVKCRPPGNREPAADEVATCAPYLERQIEIIRPRVIITLGRPASQYMLQTRESMGRMRGRWHEWRGIKVMPTYHPAYVLRNYSYETRSAVWNDLQAVMKELGLPLPQRPRRE
ncbi:MAG TPA: uracil-DNA glycosylase, partial [Tepidisphaeraceae bacterium]|nr:uracil-DNA glycosylase [Tepidisphaeraceae bacterium]